MIKNGESFDEITEEEALQLFAQDIAEFETIVINNSNNKNVVWTQQEFDAFVSFAFNAGSNVSGLMNYIINGTDPYEAFSMYCYSNKEFSLGLWRRRMDEADIFVSGTYTRDERDYSDG